VKQEDGLFDFALIDGNWRAQCVEPAIRAMSAGRLLYIDNVDGPGRDAAQLMRNTLPGVEVRHYTDLVPGVGAPTTGMSVHIR
jgi:predicted O-methyltransferase YrrM